MSYLNVAVFIGCFVSSFMIVIIIFYPALKRSEEEAQRRHMDDWNSADHGSLGG